MGVEGLDLLTQDPQMKVEEGDHEKFAHYVIGGAEAVLRSIVEGTPCEALCGKIWVPSRDPERFPVCPDCERIRKERGLGVD